MAPILAAWVDQYASHKYAGDGAIEDVVTVLGQIGPAAGDDARTAVKNLQQSELRLVYRGANFRQSQPGEERKRKIRDLAEQALKKMTPG